MEGERGRRGCDEGGGGEEDVFEMIRLGRGGGGKKSVI